MIYLTTQELSNYIKRSPGAIRNLVLRRKIPFRKVGRRLFFIQEEIDEWIGGEGLSLFELKKFNEINKL